VTPDGQLVWKWNSLDHIGLGQTTKRWWEQVLASGRPALDIQHWNAVEPAGRNLLLSFRHLDAVYAIDRTTGAIVWKLGGTHTSKSLKVLNDPEGAYPLAGQHDPRVLPDGTISIFDNFTGLNKPPRVVRYRINPTARTARLVQSFTDPTATRSVCCGSARMLPSGLPAPVPGRIQLPVVPGPARRSHGSAAPAGDERHEPLNPGISPRRRAEPALPRWRRAVPTRGVGG
jgi:hypothetical protein